MFHHTLHTFNYTHIKKKNETHEQVYHIYITYILHKTFDKS